ncbi:hypothetical protein EJB05_33497, partial [Eragrostis curvula]
MSKGWKADGFDERRVGGRKFRYLCNRFNGLQKPEELRPKQFVEMVEDVATLLCDSFTAVEAQDVEEGLLPKCRVNRIFDSLKITYPDHEMPMGRRRLKKGEEPEIPTTSYIQMRGWEKKAEAAVEASPSVTVSGRSGLRTATRKMKASVAAGLSTVKAERSKRKRTVCRGVRGAVDPDSTGTEPASGSHAEESVAGGNADLADEMPPAFEVSDSEVLLEVPESKGFVEDAVIDLFDSEEFLDGSNDQVDVMTVDDAGLARALHEMVNDTQSSSGRAAGTSDSEASRETSSSAESSSGAVNYDEVTSIATAMMSGLRELDLEELWINLESNSAPDLTELLERQGRVGAPAELIALRKEKSQWEATKASFENEILRLKSEAKKSEDDFMAYKTEAEKKHAEADEDRAALSGALREHSDKVKVGTVTLHKLFSDFLARYGRSAQDLSVGEEITLDTLLSWLEREL